MPRRWFLLPIVVLVLAAAAAPPPAAGEGGRTLRRTEDPVVVPGAKLTGALGWEIAQTRLFAFRDGRAAPIPFQIDERDKNGAYFLPFGPGRKSGDGRIKPRDELVFMVADAGERGARAQLPGEFDGAVELEIADPLDGGTAWVSLVHYANAAPPRSPVSYVRYDDPTTTIDAARYLMAFHPKARLSIGKLSLKPAGGGANQNLVDRLKIRFTATIAGLKLERNEENFLSRTVGWINGPVRVVRHTVNQVELWKIKSPKAYMDNVYYGNSFEFPTVIEMPFGADLLMKDPRFRVSTDGLCNVPGRVFYNSNNRNGVKIDGVPTEEKKHLDRGPYAWSVVTDPTGKGAWMNRLLYDASATPVRPNLYFNDDRAARDGPEDDPGECGDLGYTLENVGELKRDKLYLKSIMYNMNDFRLDRVPEYLKIIDRPLTVRATAL